MDFNITALVVTNNRKALLKECIEAILSQSREIDHLIIIDNASTDGTGDFLSENGTLQNPKVEYILEKENLGGAGGFYEGLRIAREHNAKSTEKKYDFVWLMDDDTVPEKDCLSELILAYEIASSEEKRVSFIASSVYGANGEFMNVPGINNKKAPNGYRYFYEHLSDGMLNISYATFVSLLINMDAVSECGLPCKDYFLWGDDTEYTLRLTKHFGDAYMSGKSVAIHKRKEAKDITINDCDDDPVRMSRFFYLYRNNFINEKLYFGMNHPCLRCMNLIRQTEKNIIGKNKELKKKIIRNGYKAGLREWPRFKEYIDGQIKS